MIKLLNANVFRLKKNIVFKALLIIVVVLALLMVYIQYKNGNKVEIQQLIFNLSTMCGIGISVLVSLFIGTEYSDGTIRNKIIVGNNRLKIYLSNFILMFLSSIIIYILFSLVVCIIGFPLFGGITMNTSEFIFKIIGIIGIILVYNAIFTFISMIIQNNISSSVASILIAFGLIFIALMTISKLSETPTIQVGQITNEETNEYTFIEEPNPNYPTETERKIYQTILDVIPSGQALQITGRLETDFRVLPFYSLIITIILTGTGLIIFKKMDLK